MQMTKSQAVLVAKLISDLRPDWDFHGCMAALAKATGKAGAFDVAIAAITAAADPDAETPGVIPTDGHHWPTWGVERQESERDRDRRRTREIHDRRVLEELRQSHREFDPEVARRGYRAATKALGGTA